MQKRLIIIDRCFDNEEDKKAFESMIDNIQTTLFERMNSSDSGFSKANHSLIICSVMANLLANLFFSACQDNNLRKQKKMAVEIHKQIGIMFFDTLKKFQAMMANEKMAN